MTNVLGNDFTVGKNDRQAQIPRVTENPVAPPNNLPSIGTVLREGREANTDKSIEEISADLCVRPHLLRALEADEYDRLPGVAYITGFIRQYGRYLSLDAEALVARYKEMIGHENCTPKLDFPEAMDDGRPSAWMVAAAALVLMAGAYGAWSGLAGGHDDMHADISAGPSVVADSAGTDSTGNVDNTVLKTVGKPAVDAVEEHSAMAAVAKPAPGHEQAITLTSSTETAVEPVETAAPVAPSSSQTAIPVAAQGTGSIVLRARADSYVRIVGADKTVFIDRVLHAGDEFQAPDRDDLSLTTGNAGALDIIVNGVAVSPMGPVGAVRKQVSLNVDQLLNNR